jgi:Asp-tRNA(Asn)/Glu-tRNA(Gln) amidotransferase B subunit
MQLDHDFLKRWEQIVNDVDKDHCPISCVKKVVFRTKDRRQRSINIRNLRKQGIDEDSIERAVGEFIEQNEDIITSMELVLDVEAVAEMVQPETDRLLKGM